MLITIPDNAIEIIIKTSDGKETIIKTSDREKLEYKMAVKSLPPFETRPLPEEPYIAELGLSTRVQNALWRNGIHTIPELITCERGELLQMRGLGESYIDEIAVKLKDNGYEEAFLRFAFPDHTLEEITEARNDPDSVLHLDSLICYRLFRAGYRSLEQLRACDSNDLLEKGLRPSDIKIILSSSESR